MSYTYTDEYIPNFNPNRISLDNIVDMVKEVRVFLGCYDKSLKNAPLKLIVNKIYDGKLEIPGSHVTTKIDLQHARTLITNYENNNKYPPSLFSPTLDKILEKTE